MNICHPGVSASFHGQVVNRKLGPVDFCPPFITLLIVKVISLLEQFLSVPSWLDTILRGYTIHNLSGEWRECWLLGQWVGLER